MFLEILFNATFFIKNKYQLTKKNPASSGAVSTVELSDG